MNGIDIFVLILLLFFSLRGLLVGFLKELLSLVGLILAVFISLRFNDVMGFYLRGIKDPLLLKVLSILILFVLIIMLTQLVIFLLRKLLKPKVIGFMDRILGLLFGFFEGFVFAGTILYFAGRFEFTRQYIEKTVYAWRVSSFYEHYVVRYFSDVKEFFENIGTE